MIATDSKHRTEVFTLDELAGLVDARCRKYLQISGWDFVEKDSAGQLPDAFITQHIRTLINLAEGNKRQSLLQRLHRRAERDAQQDHHGEQAHHAKHPR